MCGSQNLTSVIALGEQTLTGVFPKSPGEQMTRGPLELVKCEGEEACGLVQLGHSYDLTEIYGGSYGYRSGLNQSMTAHLRDTVRDVQTRVEELTRADLVLDIGSNDGTLLGCYPDTITRVGMDPTAAKFRQFYKPGIEIISDFFSAEEFQRHCGMRKAKIITSIAMFYDLEAPMAFVEQVASILADDGIWYFEQSYLPAMLGANAYDTICHEHLEYYSLKQIKWMVDRCGLKLVDVELNDINGGSFAVTVAKTRSSISQNSSAIERILAGEKRAALDTLHPYEQFRERVFDHRNRLLDTLAKLRQEDATVLGYGASTKGNVILQFCGLNAEHIPCIAEVNPDKFGRFTPGTYIPIVSEAKAHAMNPDYLLVLPWHFRENLLEREAAFLGRGGKMIFPLPDIEIVGQ
jgi:hypothetical protein